MTDTGSEPMADVCVVGLGYVGLTLSVAFAKSGTSVVGVERNPSAVEAVRAGRAFFHEDGLDLALAEVLANGRLTAVELNRLPAARAYVIAVGTPVHDGVVQLRDLEQALVGVAKQMPDDVLVVLRSTLAIGTTRSVAVPLLGASGRRFRLAVAPERTVEGNALVELTTLPQIIGGLDRASTEGAAALFARLGAEIVTVETVEAAELAKLASNAYRDLHFAFANELAYIADTVGIDVYDVIRACNLGYSRADLPSPGPVGGPCLGKDTLILAASALGLGSSAPLTEAGRRVNSQLVAHVQTILDDVLSSSPAVVGICGTAFKGQPATSDVRGSMAGDFARSFRGEWKSAQIIGWDPLVPTSETRSLGIEPVSEADLLARSSVLLVQTNHPHFCTGGFIAALGNLPPDAVVIDLWNQLPRSMPGRDDLRLFALGRMRADIST